MPPHVIGKAVQAFLCCHRGIPTILKGSTMNPQFLRSEAARFRGMAVDADSEATKLRLLAMATDYEARAGIEPAIIEPNSNEASSELAQANSDETNAELVEPSLGESIRIKPGRMTANGLKESAQVRRRSVSRRE